MPLKRLGRNWGFTRTEHIVQPPAAIFSSPLEIDEQEQRKNVNLSCRCDHQWDLG
jgi:hypothetical protein